jgi:hypothetical protein
MSWSVCWRIPIKHIFQFTNFPQFFTFQATCRQLKLTTREFIRPLLSQLMKKTLRSKITVTSSLHEISTDQLGNRVVRGSFFRSHPCLQEASRHIFEDDVNGGFFSQSFFMSPLRPSFVLVPKRGIIVAKLKNCKLYCAQVRNTKVVSKTQRRVNTIGKTGKLCF